MSAALNVDSLISSGVRAVHIGLLVILAGGCGGSRREPTEIRFWAMGAEGENVQQLLPEFERRYPDIRVRLQIIPWTAAHEKLLTAYAGNSTPDVCQLGNTWIPEFIILNALEPLDQRLRSSPGIHDSSYFPGIRETNMVDGILFGIPWYVDTRVLFYRKDILARVGYAHAPRTWEEWHDVCQRIVDTGAETGHYAMLLPTTEWAPPVILGMQTGSRFLRDRDTYGDFSGPEFSRAFTFYIDFFNRKFAPVGLMAVTNIYQSFAEGYFAMYITGPWNIGEFRRRLPPALQDVWMTAPLPGPDINTPGMSLAGGSSLVMFSASTKKDDVWKLIEFLSEPEQQVRFYRITGDLPARTEAWQDTSLTGNPYARAFLAQLKHVGPTPKIPQWEQIAMKVQDYAEIAARRTRTVQQSLEALDREVDIILEKRRWMVNAR
jgi:multiple sugar transport system substrate-binding protein